MTAPFDHNRSLGDTKRNSELYDNPMPTGIGEGDRRTNSYSEFEEKVPDKTYGANSNHETRMEDNKSWYNNDRKQGFFEHDFPHEPSGRCNRR